MQLSENTQVLKVLILSPLLPAFTLMVERTATSPLVPREGSLEMSPASTLVQFQMYTKTTLVLSL